MSADGGIIATTGSVGAHGPYHALRIVRIIDETADARSFVLAIPEELRSLFAYRAGQFLTFRVTVNGERFVRCYSLASSPEVDAEHKVTIKRIDEGRVSNWMNETLSAGDDLETMRPAGVFCLQERTTPLVLFSGGSGITPVISIVKTALASTERRVRLVYANRDRESIIFRGELDALASRYATRFELFHRLDVEEGFIDSAAVRGYVGSEAGADFYVCGPTAFMDTVEATLQELGVDSDRLLIERFVSLSGDGTEAAATAPAEGDAAPANVQVTLDGETRDIPRDDMLKRVLELFDSTGADCLCRPQPLEETVGQGWGAAISRARHSRLGHNPGSDIYSPEAGFTQPETAGAAYRIEILRSLGGYDERFDACEDVEFNHRVALAGYTAYKHPDLAVSYEPRNSLIRLFQQMKRYGRGRARLMARHPEMTPWPLVALATTAFLVLLLLPILGFKPWIPLALALGLVYALACGLFSFRVSQSVPEALKTALVFPVIHGGLLTGFVRGIPESLYYKIPPGASDMLPEVRPNATASH